MSSREFGTQFPDVFAALCAPFDHSPESREVKWRIGSGGKQVAYITARTAMNRLDDVLGPENWWDDYDQNANGVTCRLTIRLPDGSMVTKADAGGNAGMADAGDDDKSGFSDAFKRAAAKFGVARYLYRDNVPEFAWKAFEGVPPLQPPAQDRNGYQGAQRPVATQPNGAYSRNGNSRR